MNARRPWAVLCFLLMTTLGSGCDLATKAWAERSLGGTPGGTLPLSSWLELSLAYNRGTAFSFIGDLGTARLVLGVMAMLAVAVLLWMVLRAERPRRLEALALGAIAAGAIGNAFDRLFRLAPGGGTGVVDFIKLNYPWGGSWPTFNVADVLVGAGAIALVLLRLAERPDAPTPQAG
jgi:signal peptidase II